MTSVLVAADGHYYRDSTGNVYTEAVFNYDFYRRYLSVFDTVFAVGRVEDVAEAPEGKKRADGPGIHFLDLEPGRGLKGFLKTRSVNARRIKTFLDEVDCVIARVPGVVANMVVRECDAVSRPYSIEVVVDPWEYFSPDARPGFVNAAVRRQWTTLLKKACRNAEGVSYVTERYLQQKYPCAALLGNDKAFTANYSSVELKDDSFATPRKYGHVDELIIAHAANSFQGNSKGHYTLFDSMRLVLDRGYNARLICIGDGPSRNAYEEYVDSLGLADRVEFTGRLADSDEVRRRISEADVFVFPTKAEGLPRVLLEAMAEGLPCLSTPVCGIPEILPQECLFKSDDSDGFANALAAYIESPELMEKQSSDNIAVARRYSSSKLGERRKLFYSKVLQCSKGRA